MAERLQSLEVLLFDKGFKIEPEEIKLETPIKSIGEYKVTVNFRHDITAQLKIKVVKREE